MKYLLTSQKTPEEALKKSPFKLSFQRIGSWYLYSEDSSKVFQDEAFAGMCDGYLRNLNLQSPSPAVHTLNCFEKIANQWPVPENITGSFSSFIVNKSTGELILCNDLIGLYPLYYLNNGSGFFVSNSIMLMAAVSGNPLDEVGILQRTIGQDFSNIGSRTVIEGCKRLLPGELKCFDKEGNCLKTKYDNSLFQEMSASHQDHELHKEYWEDLKKEVEFCLLGNSEVKVALSGGIDSRIALASIPSEKKIECLTFGAKENYEVKIASRLARIKGAAHKNFYQPELYFPSAEVLRKYTKETEAVQICSWLEILENVSPQTRTPLLFGELCEALPARNIKKYNTREFRQRNFSKYVIFKKDYLFEESTPERFENWKTEVTKRYLIYYQDIRRKRTAFEISYEELTLEVEMDLEELFSRIEAHRLPYTELYDELFSWYTFTRMRLAKQLQLTGSKFKSYSTSMSMQVLRNTSNIHPNLRLNYRFVKKLFNGCEELRKYNKVPTGQVPIIPQYFPDLIKFPVWGIRSKIDSHLIKKMMKKRNPAMRYRLFKAVDWAGAYQNPEMEKNLAAYFKNNHLGEGFYQNLLKESIDRKKLKKWPFANIDIINAASLNTELDLIKSYQSSISS